MASTSPLLPLLPSGDLPPVAAVAHWLGDLRREQLDTVIAGALPVLNGSLPDLLALGGVTRLVFDCAAQTAFRWEGHGGARVSVTACGSEADEGMAVHHGRLATGVVRVPGDDHSLQAQCDLARLEDAAAVLGTGAGASWTHLLTALDRGHAPQMPVLRPRPADGGSGAWNPLPFARETVVSLPAETRPWGLADARGRRHPAQVVEGPAGPELLVSLPLGALECTPLTPIDEPVPGCHWEVDASTLDNGVVRVELDRLGQVVRLCVHGVFAELAGPAVAAEVDGQAVGGSATVEVVESGPVRARVVVTRTIAAGTLRLSYTLHAHEDVLRVSATWSGEGRLELAHPTTHRGALLRLAGELAPERREQAASVTSPAMAPMPGARWAVLDDGGGRGLAVVAARPMEVSARAGALRVSGGSMAAYALCGGARPSEALGLGRLAQHLATPGRSYSGDDHQPPLLRVAGAPELVPLWVRRPEGWTGELLLADQSLRRGRAWLMTRGGAPEAWRVDAGGGQRERLPATPEGDGVQIDYAAGEVLLVRWR